MVVIMVITSTLERVSDEKVKLIVNVELADVERVSSVGKSFWSVRRCDLEPLHPRHR